MAARKHREQAEARRLRVLGWSLRRIATQLGVSLSSVSVWVRDVAVPEPAQTEGSPPAQTEGPPPGPPEQADEPAGTRRCGACAAVLPLTRFNRLRDGHQWWCRDCFRDYFARRGDRHRRQSREARRRREAAAEDFVLAYLASHPCLDCEVADPVVLEFDHVGEKRDQVSRMVAQGVSVGVLRREVAGCEVVCVNCHRRRTARRGGWRRASPAWRSTPTSRLPSETRNIDHAYTSLERCGCVDCGTKELCVLDFDHVSAKSGNVLDLARSGCSLGRLAEEISHCEVRCGNCHRRRTAQSVGYYRHLAPKL